MRTCRVCHCNLRIDELDICEFCDTKEQLASAQREVAEANRLLTLSGNVNRDLTEASMRLSAENAALRERLNGLVVAVNARKHMYGDLTEAEEDALHAALTTTAQGEK
jgi:hypothetical protein